MGTIFNRSSIDVQVAVGSEIRVLKSGTDTDPLDLSNVGLLVKNDKKLYLTERFGKNRLVENGTIEICSFGSLLLFDNVRNAGGYSVEDVPLEAVISFEGWWSCTELGSSQPAKIKSGKYWVTWANANALNSTKIDDLETDFKTKVKEFIEALEDAGATIQVESTRRSKKRAYLFHWSWKIYLDKATPSEADAAERVEGVNIQWNHGDLDKSKKGAKEMVDGFGLAVPPRSNVPPSLTSNHIIGKAIDMYITWTGTIKVKKKDGTEVEITYIENPNSNTKLHEVGKSYGVIKHLSDRPHWSHNGR